MADLISLEEVKKRATPAPDPLSDIYNAQRLIEMHGQDMIWTPERHWCVWNGSRWQADEMRAVVKFAKNTARRLYANAGDDESKEWAIRLHSASRLRAMLDLAIPEKVGRLTDFDSHPLQFNAQNGVVDLSGGELRPHRRDDLHMRQSPIVFDGGAKCPLFLEALAVWMDGDTELVEYLQRAAGYSLTGETTEQNLFFAYGTGKNGKSVFLETLAAAMGDYAIACRTQTVMASRSGGVPNDVARLAGARFVSMNETADGQRFDEPLIKDLTGGDTIQARFLYREYFDFRPAFKLWIRGNHLPQIRGTDEGIWRRIHLIPFTRRISDRECDRHLMKKLRRELPGILAWAVAGCIKWQRDGLGPPAKVLKATADYRADMDTVQPFIDERCECGPTYEVTASALYGAYRKWSHDTGADGTTQQAFGRSLTMKGYRREKRGTYRWHGLKLRQPERSHWAE